MSGFIISADSETGTTENWRAFCRLLQQILVRNPPLSRFASRGHFGLSRGRSAAHVLHAVSAPVELLGWVAGTTRGHHPKLRLILEGGPHEGCTASQKEVLRYTTTPPICAAGSIPPGSLKTTILDGTIEELRIHREVR